MMHAVMHNYKHSQAVSLESSWNPTPDQGATSAELGSRPHARNQERVSQQSADLRLEWLGTTPSNYCLALPNPSILGRSGSLLAADAPACAGSSTDRRVEWSMCADDPFSSLHSPRHHKSGSGRRWWWSVRRARFVRLCVAAGYSKRSLAQLGRSLPS